MVFLCWQLAAIILSSGDITNPNLENSVTFYIFATPYYKMKARHIMSIYKKDNVVAQAYVVVWRITHFEYVTNNAK